MLIGMTMQLRPEIRLSVYVLLVVFMARRLDPASFAMLEKAGRPTNPRGQYEIDKFHFGTGLHQMPIEWHHEVQKALWPGEVVEETLHIWSSRFNRPTN